VAVGQELLGTAQAIARLKAREGQPDWDQVAALFTEWRPDLAVVGLPLNMDDTENEMCQRARKFAKRLHGRLHVPVAMMDERLSSFEAKGQAMAQGGSRDYSAHGVDDQAAVLILQSWLNG
jgi:putative Holliday junction resolvase